MKEKTTTNGMHDGIARGAGEHPESPARRRFLGAGGAALAAPLILGASHSAAKNGSDDSSGSSGSDPSPPTTPWVQYLPDAIVPLPHVSTLTPDCTETANVAGGECGRNPHQRYAEMTNSVAHENYELRAVERPDWVFHPAYPPQPLWCYEDAHHPDSTSAAPVVFARYGHSVMCRFHNALPQDHVGFGTPEISVHLHNLHTPSESDGFPGDYFSPLKAGPTLTEPGRFKDHFYPNVYAGYDEQRRGLGDPAFAARDANGNIIGDWREALGTLFYHDHTLDFTAPNVYRGLAGFYLLYDHLDSGDENDPNPAALRLPSHPYDYPLNFADRRFDKNGRLVFDQLSPEGTLGDKIIVNGKIEPVLRVAARKYRFRLLNSGPSRNYEFYLVTARDKVESFTLIANDGNLLPAPLTGQTKARLGVAVRADIVVDFSKYPIGTELYLVNRLRQDDTRKPDKLVTPGTRVLKFVVNRGATDTSRVPAKLRPVRLPSAAELKNARVRRWEFDRKGGLWVVNDQLVDVHTPRAIITEGGYEIWELVNNSGGWLHPIHIHFEEGIIVGKTAGSKSAPLEAHEQGRKDVYVLEPGMSLRVFLRFRDFVGKYVMHCHNVIHEDHAMMVRWDIVKA
ncbi:FtsP/CotA-like multicopper oxidase with cupredoxin domain [Crenobacter luteus]|uniref:multicopper oxidase family protein n=1 Tax=Crenobacter luteus TaxID=1452487 RepID=UPI0010D0994D|nr:multicopper oxidase domain-containing protein [Crenobacter luteus]TCP15537.1 FtsP/CotA-like multicopper oxidase with cupredoxin domain [Crenobacter luteus]